MLYDLGDVRLNAIAEGDGPAIVFLHPLGGSWRYWEAQLDALVGDHRCVVPDLRGFGASDRLDGPFSFPALAGDVGRLLDLLDVKRATIVGLSMGGMVAQYLALARPELVERLVLAATTCFSDPALAEAIHGAVALIETNGIGMFVELSGGMSWAPATATEQPGLLRRFRREEGCTDPRTYARAVAAIADLDLRSELAAVAAPTLVVWGEEDQWMPIDHAHRLIEALPKARLEVLAGAGHLCNLEQPAAFTGLVRSFIADRAPA